MISPLSATYADARSAFLEAAAAAGARIESHPHPLRGLHDEELAIDVAEVGPVDAEDVVIVVSGTHGVEGYCGSALQRHHLELLAGHAPSPVTTIFVHALNPFGFSWVRRVNEDNVDLNRNFIDWSSPPPSNDDYDVLADLLVPISWTAAEQERTLTGLLGVVGEWGMDRVQAAVSAGQYDHPKGLFHGGQGPVWSHRWLRTWTAERLQGVRRAAIIDLHTGLGPWGHGELISGQAPGTPEHERAVEWWHDVTSMVDDSSVSALLWGDWLNATSTLAPHVEFTAIALEYGTVDPLVVLQALRSDAWLHGFGDPRAPEAAEVRAGLRAAFADDDPTWLDTLWPTYHSVITAAGERLGGSAGGV
jgi:Protein of unknown function (DUF2817)